jgi:hypothetical protein
MMGLLSNIRQAVRNVVRRHHQALCVKCRSVQQVKTLRYVESITSRRLVRRVIGRCPVCTSQTSTFIG